MQWVSTSGAMRIPVISGSEGSENARGSVPCLTAADGVSGFSRHQIQRLPDRPHTMQKCNLCIGLSLHAQAIS